MYTSSSLERQQSRHLSSRAESSPPCRWRSPLVREATPRRRRRREAHAPVQLLGEHCWRRDRRRRQLLWLLLLLVLVQLWQVMVRQLCRLRLVETLRRVLVLEQVLVRLAAVDAAVVVLLGVGLR